ncbi:MAG TPA: hypothetical protein VGL02_22330 [Streptomyces sp.]|uniref:Transmembrane protein n=1 Tax=Amycolatopsis nalaikhensis TaxID=715472 RepID=A0ABY8XE50_9PSEU|nr:hypothetical protein [Amycolatopsis sp. 2-2]WIV53892.1 hypothetical protein QP939_34145 [Amycolatopsis sp. 2-2]
MTVAAAVAFIWLGLVLGISFLEAPLKFRAPGVTLQVGLGIGRLVFAALNRVEVLLAAAVWVALLLGHRSVVSSAMAGAVVLVLIVQLVAVRPALTRRSDRVLAGEEGPRSHAHLVYVGLEVVRRSPGWPGSG